MLSEKLTNQDGEFVEGPLLLKPTIFEDNRGFFMESWNREHLNQIIGKTTNFVQDNHSQSHKGVLRGLHYQVPPNTQGKLVRCVHGEIFDVAVDIRQGSKSFGQWVGAFINSTNHYQIWIPIGFAHGFLTISKDADVIYKTTDFWSPKSERSIRWNDPRINIKWPNLDSKPLLSIKDEQASFLLDLQKEELF